MARRVVTAAAPQPPLELVAARDGVVVPVVARPRARRDALAGNRAGALLIDVAAATADGAANAAILALLATLLGVPRSAVTLKVGGAARRKHFRVVGLDAATVRARLTTALRVPP